MFSVVNAGQRVSDGVRLSGRVGNLDNANGDQRHQNECSALKFGFFTYDWTQSANGIAGCAGYSELEDARNSRNMQFHWWGAGNSYSDFRPHGLFVR